jgi:hypothetical protein
LTSDGDGSLSSTTVTAMTTTSSGPSNHKPKRKQVRPTASAIQQRRTNNLKAKRHKSGAHKAAVRLYVAEKKKPKGMSPRQVRAVITSKYEESLSAASICRYAKQGLVNTSPMKMEPAGHISTMAYKLVCQAYSSLVPINQMNACAGINSRKMMIPMIAETLNIGTVKAMGVLNRVVRDTAIEINFSGLPHPLYHVPELVTLV